MRIKEGDRCIGGTVTKYQASLYNLVAEYAEFTSDPGLRAYLQGVLAGMWAEIEAGAVPVSGYQEVRDLLDQ